MNILKEVISTVPRSFFCISLLLQIIIIHHVLKVGQKFYFTVTLKIVNRIPSKLAHSISDAYQCGMKIIHLLHLCVHNTL